MTVFHATKILRFIHSRCFLSHVLVVIFFITDHRIARRYLARERDLNLRRVQLCQIFAATEDAAGAEVGAKREAARAKHAAETAKLGEHQVWGRNVMR